jgi:hypothetical protein
MTKETNRTTLVLSGELGKIAKELAEFHNAANLSDYIRGLVALDALVYKGSIDFKVPGWLFAAYFPEWLYVIRLNLIRIFLGEEGMKNAEEVDLTNPKTSTTLWDRHINPAKKEELRKEAAITDVGETLERIWKPKRKDSANKKGDKGSS